MKNVPLFDLGNVVIQFRWDPFLAWVRGRTTGQGRPEPEAVLKSSLFFDFEAGLVRREEFAGRIATLYGAEFTQAELEEAWCSIFLGPVPGMAALLAELSRIGPLYALSNTNEVHLEWMRRQRGLLDSFTRVFASNELGLRKPDPKIYLRVADEIGVSPSSLVFFDDIEANIEGAHRAGLKAYLFRETGEARRYLLLAEGRGEMGR